MTKKRTTEEKVVALYTCLSLQKLFMYISIYKYIIVFRLETHTKAIYCVCVREGERERLVKYFPVYVQMAWHRR